MSKIITIKLRKINPLAGPFSIVDEFNNEIAIDVTKDVLVNGVNYEVDDSSQFVIIESTGKCKIKKTFSFSEFTSMEYAQAEYTPSTSATLWAHLKNSTVYNKFYGNACPYIIEYPFAYQFQDELLQSVIDFTRVYKYIPDDIRDFNNVSKVQIDNVWFNKAVIYNDQQSTGLLELSPRPINNLSAYSQYPIYKENSKEILYSKSDNFYQYNTFWSVVKDKNVPLFKKTCESLSIDKEVNHDNMDYTIRSFRKELVRAKDVKIRHILDNTSDVNIVSQFIIAESKKSYK